LRRHRRLVLTDRFIPFLAAFVGLISLSGAVLVQLSADSRNQNVGTEIAALRTAVDELSKRAEGLAATDAELAAADDDGTVDAMLALQDRMNKLEEAWEKQPITTASAAGGSPLGGVSGPYAPAVGSEAAAIDPSWPTENCIPLGTRFMMSVGDSVDICQTPVVVKVSAITGDNVMVDGAGVINETAFKPIIGSNCTLLVFSADAEGFAEMRVSCN
jgi:hypothetical protein